MRVAIYLRTSTGEQNPENQLKDCVALASRLNLKDHECIREHQSAFKDNKREKFEGLRSEIKKGSVKNLIVWDLDRLYRNRKKLVSFFKLCETFSCKVYSVRQDWLESINTIQEPFNEIMFAFMLQIMGWLAEDESKKKSDRVKISVRRSKGKPTKSYKGKKWGRPKVHTNKINVIIGLYEKGLSYRKIHKISRLSIGKISEIVNVHKNKKIIKGGKPIKNDSS